MTTPLDVRCEPDADGWRCSVTVGDDPAASTHEVTLSGATLASLAPGADHPDDLVRISFEFLLEREPRESILRRFELMLIRRYFPDWEGEIRRRLSS